MNQLLIKGILIASFLLGLIPTEGLSKAPQMNRIYSSWGILPGKTNSINLQKALAKFKAKKEITVAVVDTGIDPHHPYLKDNIMKINGNPNFYGLDFSKGRKGRFHPYDRNGHGTHIAGIIKSVYSKVKILPIKYYSRKANGMENYKATLESFKAAIRMGVDIINFSGGGVEASFIEKNIMKDAEKKGILVISAAGNESSHLDLKKNFFFPANYRLSNIVSVSAHDQNLKMLPFSNYGSIVDVAAPGESIKAAFPRGRVVSLSGTSQATAFVTGVAAILKAKYPNLKPWQIKRIIRQSSKPEPGLRLKVHRGGRLDAYQAIKLADQFWGTPQVTGSVN